MALLRQYSLLNLPPTWKASLISSYGSFLTQNQQDFSSPFHRASFLGRAAARGIALLVAVLPHQIYRRFRQITQIKLWVSLLYRWIMSLNRQKRHHQQWVRYQLRHRFLLHRQPCRHPRCMRRMRRRLQCSGWVKQRPLENQQQPRAHRGLRHRQQTINKGHIRAMSVGKFSTHITT